GPGQPGQNQTLVDHQRQPKQSQQQSRQTPRREAPLGEHQGENRLCPQHRGQEPRRDFMLQSQEVTQGVKTDQQQADASHGQTLSSRRQQTTATNQQQGAKRESKTQNQQ